MIISFGELACCAAVLVWAETLLSISGRGRQGAGQTPSTGLRHPS